MAKRLGTTEDDIKSGDEGSASDILSITEFATRVKFPFSMAVASKRCTGKTMLVSVLIQSLIDAGKIDMCLVMSQTVHVNDDYSFLPDRLRQPFSEEVIKKLMDRQAKVPKEKREKVLLVLDDVLSDKEAEKSRFIKRLYTLGRHYSLAVCLISQSSNVALTPAIKQNSDWLIWSRLNYYQLSVMFESITNMKKKEFIQWSEENNKDYVFLCVDNTSNSNKPADFLLKIRVSEEEAERLPSGDEISESSSESDASWSQESWF